MNFSSKIQQRYFGKKGQIAMEYVHTYGWIILSVIMLGGVLFYYLMSNPIQILPNECKMITGIRCLDVEVEDTFLRLEIVNEFGFAISNITMTLVGTCNASANTSDTNPYNNPSTMLMNMQKTVTFECQNLTGLDIKEKINMSYRSVESNQTHWKVGRLEYKEGE